MDDSSSTMKIRKGAALCSIQVSAVFADYALGRIHMNAAATGEQYIGVKVSGKSVEAASKPMKALGALERQ
jgi:hypothetical protein